jgi:carnitine 3-dehydrogenase
VAIQQVLRQFNIGAGSTLRAVEERLYEQNAAKARGVLGAGGAAGVGGDAGARAGAGVGANAAAGAGAGAGLRLIETQVRSEWVDYNGHMTDSRYLQVFGDATDALFRSVGVDDAYRRSGRAMYTVESHVTHGAEAKLLEPLYVLTRLLAVDDKRVHLFHALHRQRDDVLVATGEQMYLHVDTNAGKAALMDSAVREKLEKIRAAQSGLAPPAQAGRHVGMPRT